MRYLVPLPTVWALVACLNASPANTPAGWGPVQYLMGDWIGEGGGAPGQGSGSFSFKPDLQGKILVRKNRAEYPATKDREAVVHDDLMVVYRDTPDGLCAQCTSIAKGTPFGMKYRRHSMAARSSS
jgi:hypothetical protein